MKIPTLYLCILAPLMLSTQSSMGVVIAGYDFTNLSPSTVEPGVLASTLDDYSTLNAGATNPNTNRNLLGAINVSAGNPSPAIVGTFQTFGHNRGSLSDALTAETFIEFTVTPGAGTTFDFTDFTVDMRKPGSGGAAINVHLLVDQNSNGWDTGDDLGTDSFTVNGSSWETLSVDASGLGTVSSATTFRAYFYTPGTGAANPLQADNLVINGTVNVTAIPEPSTALLGMVGLLALFRRRR